MTRTLEADITFTLPASRLDHDPAVYLTYDAERQRPTEVLRVPVRDLRADLGVQSVADQLKERGFAVARHESQWLDGLPSVEGTKKYLEESAALLQAEIGCTRVIPWNSVCRKNDPNVQLKNVERQTGPEEGRVPTERTQPVAGVAHVDQDEVWAAQLVAKAAPGAAYTRAAIINLWRPLNVVHNAPLAVCDFRTLDAGDISKHASMFGVGMDVHHNSTQAWGYIRHQAPGEVLWLQCYDSRPEGALYSAHVAVDVGGRDGEGAPRESVEVRLVALWE